MQTQLSKYILSGVPKKPLTFAAPDLYLEWVSVRLFGLCQGCFYPMPKV